MSTSRSLISAFFTALPGIFFLILFLLSSSFGKDYWSGTDLAVLIVLCIASLLFGFALPSVLKKLKLRSPWVWIFLLGLLAWTTAYLSLGLLNLTPLCVGQNNGDGNNDLGMCLFMTALSGIIYTPVYLAILAVSSMVGHRVLLFRQKT